MATTSASATKSPAKLNIVRGASVVLAVRTDCLTMGANACARDTDLAPFQEELHQAVERHSLSRARVKGSSRAQCLIGPRPEVLELQAPATEDVVEDRVSVNAGCTHGTNDYSTLNVVPVGSVPQTRLELRELDGYRQPAAGGTWCRSPRIAAKYVAMGMSSGTNT